MIIQGLLMIIPHTLQGELHGVLVNYTINISWMNEETETRNKKNETMSLIR